MLKPKKVYYLKRTPIKRKTGLKKRSTSLKNNYKGNRKEENNTMKNFFLSIWEERMIGGKCYSEISGTCLGREPLTIYFDHLLEKSVYPEFKYARWNIVLVTGDEHAQKTNGFPLPKHKELIKKALDRAEQIKEQDAIRNKDPEDESQVFISVYRNAS